MARSANSDPIEKFRFQVTVFDNIAGSFTQGTSLIGTVDDNSILARAGFSEAGAPKARTRDIEYRENTHGTTVMKMPGLTKYEPVAFRRGMTADRGLYTWYSLVNNDAGSLNKFQETLAGLSLVPYQEPNYRREVLLSVLDRRGEFVKHWLLYNAWPIEYKGANDFSAGASEIALEEIVLTYESFLEVNGSTVQEALAKAALEGEKAAAKAAAAGVAGGLLGFLNGF